MGNGQGAGYRKPELEKYGSLERLTNQGGTDANDGVIGSPE